MPVPVVFQLGLELTNIVNPISQVVSSLGSLAIVDAIRKAGSDSITEKKLASLVGRHRIDDVIEFHFREIVTKTDQSIISRYIDIVLESGAGPTVQQALKDPALFSMVIQLSGLAFAHEHESFALAIVEAIDKIVRDSGRDTAMVPDYVALLGTIRACQEQTAAFQWAGVYEAVEHKIRCALKANGRKLTDGVTEAMEENGADAYTAIDPASVSVRRLPFTILQSMLMWLQSLQSFPEHRLLHLKTDSGMSTAIVWCHHILGLTVVAKMENCEIRFGDGLSRVIVESSSEDLSQASLMNPIDQHELLFTLVEDESSPKIGYENRSRAFGYGLRTLQQARLRNEKIHYSSHWVIAWSIMISQTLSTCDPGDEGITNASRVNLYFKRPHLSQDAIVRAGKFLFALDTDDYININSRSPRVPSRICWPNLVLLVFTFARIRSDDLDACRDMPLCLSSFRSFGEIDDPGGNKEGYEVAKAFQEFDLLASFGVLTQLLLGKAFTQEYVKPAVLISAWGWSVFFDSVDADDPMDTSIDSMRVVHGVPSRHGLRKARIVDGPTDVGSSNPGRSFTKEEEIMGKCSGLTRAKRDRVLVGQTSDAFQITQMFKWSDGSRLKDSNSIIYNIAKMGFREMQEMCLHSKSVPACSCQVPYTAFKCFFDDTHNIEMVQDGRQEYPGWLAKRSNDATEVLCTIRWPRVQNTQSLSHERVLRCRLLLPHSGSVEGQVNRQIWLWDVSKAPAARWVQSWFFRPHDDDEERCCLIINGRDTCWRCAYNKALDFANDTVLVERDMRIRVLL